MSDFYFRNKQEYIESIIDAIIEIERCSQEQAVSLVEQSAGLIEEWFKLKISAENIAAHILGIKSCQTIKIGKI